METTESILEFIPSAPENDPIENIMMVFAILIAIVVIVKGIH